MLDSKPTKKQLRELVKQVKRDQIKSSPAEKRAKINTTFEEAVKKMGQTPPPKKQSQ